MSFNRSREQGVPSVEHREQPSRIVVSFRKEGSEIKGSIVQDDALHRDKIVFVDGYRPERPNTFLGKLPEDGSVWECTVVRDTRPDHKEKGALIVRLASLVPERGDSLSRTDVKAWLSKRSEYPEGFVETFDRALKSKGLLSCRLVFGIGQERLYATNGERVVECRPFYFESQRGGSSPYKWEVRDASRSDDMPEELLTVMDHIDAQAEARQAEKEAVQREREKAVDLETQKTFEHLGPIVQELQAHGATMKNCSTGEFRAECLVSFSEGEGTETWRLERDFQTRELQLTSDYTYPGSKPPAWFDLDRFRPEKFVRFDRLRSFLRDSLAQISNAYQAGATFSPEFDGLLSSGYEIEDLIRREERSHGYRFQSWPEKVLDDVTARLQTFFDGTHEVFERGVENERYVEPRKEEVLQAEEEGGKVGVEKREEPLRVPEAWQPKVEKREYPSLDHGELLQVQREVGGARLLIRYAEAVLSSIPSDRAGKLPLRVSKWLKRHDELMYVITEEAEHPSVDIQATKTNLVTDAKRIAMDVVKEAGERFIERWPEFVSESLGRRAGIETVLGVELSRGQKIVLEERVMRLVTERGRALTEDEVFDLISEVTA